MFFKLKNHIGHIAYELFSKNSDTRSYVKANIKDMLNEIFGSIISCQECQCLVLRDDAHKIDGFPAYCQKCKPNYNHTGVSADSSERLYFIEYDKSIQVNKDGKIVDKRLLDFFVENLTDDVKKELIKKLKGYVQ